jgi:hypothetical protein
MMASAVLMMISSVRRSGSYLANTVRGDRILFD